MNTSSYLKQLIHLEVEFVKEKGEIYIIDQRVREYPKKYKKKRMEVIRNNDTKTKICNSYMTSEK